MKHSKILIVDGYNDEPGGLGVPPYIDIYPRYIAGAIWSVDKSVKIRYVTVDEFRCKQWIRKANNYDVVVFIAGVVVPGKYIGGRPITGEELILWARMLGKPFKVLVGPAARWGMGIEGGRKAYSRAAFKKAGFDVLVTGDPEIYFHNLIKYGENYASPYGIRNDYSNVNSFAKIGSRIIRQHPNYGRNLVVEIETYRGCSRWISGGCSYCVEPLKGKPIERDIRGIIEEISSLYKHGARAFRLGRQADFLVYGSEGLGVEEWPKPNPDRIEKLLYGIRVHAINLKVLHIDNVNPGTIAKYPKEAREALKKIVRYHTPGDVAAFGIESLDPKVIKINNLKVGLNDALRAVEIVNEVGRKIGYNGMPELLPGINFILGLPGETKETNIYNINFLKELLHRKLLVRRVNIRKLLVIENTRVSSMKYKIDKKERIISKKFINFVRKEFEPKMLLMVAPRGAIIKDLWIEECKLGFCYARQVGSYPLMVLIRGEFPRLSYISAIKVNRVHSSRSVEGIPIE